MTRKSKKLFPSTKVLYSIAYTIEPLLFSDVVQKINRWNLKNERILLLTTRNIYLFRKKRKILLVPCFSKVKRKELRIDDLTCVVKSKA